MLKGKLGLFDLLRRYYQLRNFECDTPKSNHIIPFDLGAHAWQILDDLPAVLLNDEIRVAFVHFIGKRLLDIVTSLLVHHVDELIVLHFLPLTSDLLVERF